MSRYNKRIQAINSDEQYESVFEKRGIKKIRQYRTISKTVYEKDVYQSLRTVDYTWSFGDMYFKIANLFYGDPQYWWIIASYNNRPTEAHNKIGDTLKIPTDLADALQVLE